MTLLQKKLIIVAMLPIGIALGSLLVHLTSPGENKPKGSLPYTVIIPEGKEVFVHWNTFPEGWCDEPIGEVFRPYHNEFLKVCEVHERHAGELKITERISLNSGTISGWYPKDQVMLYDDVDPVKTARKAARIEIRKRYPAFVGGVELQYDENGEVYESTIS